MNTVGADHQECMGLLPLHKSTQRVAFTNIQTEMPIAVQTTEKPIVLNIAPKQVFTDRDSEEARQKFKELNAH